MLSIEARSKFINIIKQLQSDDTNYKKQIDFFNLNELNESDAIKRVSSCKSFDLLPSLSSSSAALSAISSQTSIMTKDSTFNDIKETLFDEIIKENDFMTETNTTLGCSFQPHYEQTSDLMLIHKCDEQPTN